MAYFSPQYLSQQTAPRTLKDGMPTDDELEGLANEIVKWKTLGRRLGVGEPKLEEIDQAYDQLSEKGYHMLKYWKRRKGSSATYKALCDVLKHKFVQRKDLAEQFCYINENTRVKVGKTRAPEKKKPTMQDKTRNDLQQMKSEIRNMSDKLDTLMAQRETKDEDKTRDDFKEMKREIRTISEKLKSQMTSGEEENSRHNLEQMKKEIGDIKEKLDTLMNRSPLEEKKLRMEDDFDPAQLIDGIRQLYKLRKGWLAPFPWYEWFGLHLDDIFTRLRVVSRTKKRGTETADIVNMSGIFKPHEECLQPRTVLIEGKPAMGKTTYCQKLVYDWATGKQEAEDCFPRFETVLLLKCRDIWSDLWEAIYDQLLPRDVEADAIERFFNYILQNQTNVLLILDGLDEVAPSERPMISDIIQGRVLPKCHLVATARHGAGLTCKFRIHCDTLLEIEGFIEEDAREFILKYFKNKENLAEDLLSKLRSDENLKDMAANPLNTTLLCFVCEEHAGSFPESETQLYTEIVQCILRRHRKGLSETNEDLTKVYDAQLKHLGWIALNGLLEGNLDFEESELKSHADDFTGFGFLSAQTGGSTLRPSLRYSFLHKSFQGWFAAFYLCLQLLNNEISVDSIVADRRYLHELKQVILFLFGMLAERDKETAVALIKAITTKLKEQEVKTDGDDGLCVLLGCIKECSGEDQGKVQLLTEMADVFGSVLKLETPSVASLAESLKQWKENNDIKGVPPEIVVRGRLALEAYNKALAEGKMFDKRVPVMLIGQNRSGKTSLKKSLRGEPFNPKEESTVGIHVDPTLCEVSTEIWKIAEKDQETNSGTSISFEHHVARATVENMTQQNRAPDLEENTPEAMQSGNFPAVEIVSSSTNNDFTSLWLAIDMPGPSTHVPAEVGTVSSSNTSIQDDISDGSSNVLESVQTCIHPENEDSKPHIPDDVQTEMVKLLENESKVGDEEVHSVLWDFAGQSVYYTTHPIFLTSRAIYLLVNDLSQDPHKKAEPIMMQGVYDQFPDSYCQKTNLDYLDFWMSSVASLSSQEESDQVSSESGVLPEKLPAVFFVCTHADTPYENQSRPKTLAKRLYGSLRNKPYKTHLNPSSPFVVDNTRSGRGSDECEEVVRLRKEVLAVAKELPQMKEAIPINWLKYEKNLQAKRNEKWIDLQEAKRIASEECNIVDTEEFQTLLNFLHDKRILIHFDDTPKLDELVVLDPQWLIDVFKEVITIPDSASCDNKTEKLWKKLEEEGILDEKLLEQVWSRLIDNKATCESLLQIMDKFSLLCSWPSDASCGEQYLVPSMLMTYPTDDIMELVEDASAQIPPLFLKFKSGLVPPGLFPRLVLLFLQWGKEICSRPGTPLLYHNFARCFISEEISQSVILLCLSSSIKVVVHREIRSGADVSFDNLDGTFAGSVLRQLQLMLESMRREFFWLKNMRYEFSFICPVCCQRGALSLCNTHHKKGCRQEECLHFWSQSQLCNTKEAICCRRSAAKKSIIVDTKQFAPWFASPGNQLTIDEHNEGRLANLKGKEIALPGEVQESLVSQSCDAKDVVLQLKETKQLDQASLEQPDPRTKTLIRCLARKAKDFNRPDVFQHLRQITPAGTTGPLLSEHLDVQDIPVSKRRDLTIDLSGGDEWKEVAERLGLTPREIRFLDNRTLNPFDAALAFIARQRNITVADLYDLLNECGFPVIADLL